MTPEQFLAKLAKQPPAPVYLFLGQEGYGRRICKDALLDRALASVGRADGLTELDLDDTSLSNVFDDARSMSLFASDRVLWITGAELALPRRLSSASDGGEEGEKGSESALAAYLKAPTPGTTLVFECSRYDFSGDDKPRMDRVQKFYSAIRESVEFRHFTPESGRYLAQDIAKKLGLKIAGPELAVLLDSVSGDASRLQAELEKLFLFTRGERAVTMDDIQALVPNAAQSTIFSLVNALGRGDRSAALRSLEILVREGEYLPLALTFLSTQFRLALAAKEARLNSGQQALAFFTKAGVRIWRERAEQVVATAGAFSRERLQSAVSAIYETDKRFREGYRDDHLMMELLVLQLTEPKAATA